MSDVSNRAVQDIVATAFAAKLKSICTHRPRNMPTDDGCPIKVCSACIAEAIHHHFAKHESEQAWSIRTPPKVVVAIRELLADMGEVIVNTAGQPWEAVKGQITGVTYEMVLDWCQRLEAAAIPGEVN